MIRSERSVNNMNQYVTGTMIKKLREERGLTQLELAERLSVSDKTVSKWENAKGYPDITLIEPLADALGISLIELLSGNYIINQNRSSNLLRTKIYVCPVCGNLLTATGEAVVSCCGITLPALVAEKPDEEHVCHIERVEDEYYVTVNHEMTREHYISYMLGVSDNGIQIVKLYPEGMAEARFKINGTCKVLFYCNHHGLYEIDKVSRYLQNGTLTSE